MFAGLNGGNPAECVIALAAWTLYPSAGVACNWEGCKNKPLGLPTLFTAIRKRNLCHQMRCSLQPVLCCARLAPLQRLRKAAEGAVPSPEESVLGGMGKAAVTENIWFKAK